MTISDVAVEMKRICFRAFDVNYVEIFPGDSVFLWYSGQPSPTHGLGIVMSVRPGTDPNAECPRITMVDVMWSGMNSPCRFSAMIPWSLKLV